MQVCFLIQQVNKQEFDIQKSKIVQKEILTCCIKCFYLLSLKWGVSVLIHWNVPYRFVSTDPWEAGPGDRGRHHWHLGGQRQLPHPQQWVGGVHNSSHHLLWESWRPPRQTADESCPKAHQQTDASDPCHGGPISLAIPFFLHLFQFFMF